MGTVSLISKQVTQVESLPAVGGIPYQVTVNSRIPLAIHFLLNSPTSKVLISDFKNIFLAGGMSMSPYLANEVKRWANERGNIHVERATDWFVDFPAGN